MNPTPSLHKTTKHDSLTLLKQLLLSLLLLLITVAIPTTARAETVTLTSGQVIVDKLLGAVIVSMQGEKLSINSRIDISPFGPPSTFFTTSTAGCGCDGIGLVSFSGLTASAFAGSGNFDDSTIFGSVTLYGFFDDSFNRPPFPLTVDYTGRGALERTPTRNTFTISAVPEPTTMLLLGTGLAGVAARAQRRRKTRQSEKA